MNELYHADHICNLETIDKIYIFIEFFIPWIHKWTPELGFTKNKFLVYIGYFIIIFGTN